MQRITVILIAITLISGCAAQNGKRNGSNRDANGANTASQNTGVVRVETLQRGDSLKYKTQLKMYEDVFDSLFGKKENISIFAHNAENPREKIKRITLAEATINSPENIKLSDNYLSFNSRFPMRLGYGVSRIDLTRAFENAVDFDVDTIEGKGSIQTRFEAKIITDYSYLKEYLKIDYSSSINAIGIGGGSVEANFSRDFTNIENGFYLVIKGETEFGRIGLKNIRLKKEALDLAYANRDAFVSKYGYSFPIIENHGASVYIIFKFKSVDRSLIENLFYKNSGNFSVDIYSGSSSLSLKYDFTNLMQKQEYDLYIYSEGGESFQGIQDIIKSFNEIGLSKDQKEPSGKFSFDPIIDACAKYLGKFEFTKSKPAGYNLISYSQLNLPVETESDYPQKINFFERIKSIYNSNNGNLNILEFLANNQHLVNLFTLRNKSITLEWVQQEIGKLKVYQEYLLSRYNYLKNVQGVPNEEFYVIGPDIYLPYVLPRDLFISISSSEIDKNNFTYMVEGNYVENIQLQVNLSFGGEMSLLLFGPRGVNEALSKYLVARPDNYTYEINSPKLVFDYIFGDRILPKINELEPPNKELYPLDSDIFNYFRVYDPKKKDKIYLTDKYATAYVYLTSKNILGIVEKKLIGKLTFDYGKSNSFLFNLNEKK